MAEKRRVDSLAVDGTYLGRLRQRREMIEDGDPTGGNPEVEVPNARADWSDASVDGVTNNSKETYSDPDEKKNLRY